MLAQQRAIGAGRRTTAAAGPSRHAPPRRSRLSACCTLQRPAQAGLDAAAAAQPQGAPPRPAPARSPLHAVALELGPYVLYDRAQRLTAVWDARAAGQADTQRLCELLEQERLLLDRVTLGQLSDARGQPLVSLTLTCRREDVEAVAAALLQWTPATHVSTQPCEHCFLPQHTLAVDTEHGPIRLHLSLAGSRVTKVSPAWDECEAAADAAAAAEGRQVDAAAVAAAAVQALRDGLDDGSIELGVHHVY